jgi:phage tail sheath protein FI
VPVSPTYPGVYINELPSAVHTIVGVPTSVAAFVGTAPRGETDEPVQLNAWGDYLNEFGPLDASVPLSYAVYLFFQNGGSTALVVRVGDPTAVAAEIALSPDVKLIASSPGRWGNALTATVDTAGILPGSVNAFNLTLSDGVTQEVYSGVTLGPGPLFIKTALLGSALVTADPANTYATLPAPGKYGVAPPAAPVPAAPGASKAVAAGEVPAAGGAGEAPKAGGAGEAPKAGGAGEVPAAGGGGEAAGGAAAAAPADAAPATAAPAPPITTGSKTGADGTGPPSLGDGAKTGMWALKKADIFNILCVPAVPGATWPDTTALGAATAFCTEQRAMLIVDPPSAWTSGSAPLKFETVVGTPAVGAASPNAAVYYPNLKVRDADGSTFPFGPSAAVAGVWATTDAARGVWKAPAGTGATISGIVDLSTHVDDGESGVLNPIAVNVLRTLPLVGPVSWGARTTVGPDQLASQWKYIPVRRTALYIEESLRRGTQWVVFEPNDEPLWSSIRLNVGTFMNTMFRQGAFQGSTPADAYVVVCDASNNPQSSIDLGIVNILVGFAPLKPAEFVIINIEQLAGQA